MISIATPLDAFLMTIAVRLGWAFAAVLLKWLNIWLKHARDTMNQKYEIDF